MFNFTDKKNVHRGANLQGESVFLHRWLSLGGCCWFIIFGHKQSKRSVLWRERNLETTSLVFKVYFFFQKQENIFFFSPRNNKYTIILYEQNAQFTKVATERSTSYTVLSDCMHSTHLSQSYNCISIFYSHF